MVSYVWLCDCTDLLILCYLKLSISRLSNFNNSQVRETQSSNITIWIVLTILYISWENYFAWSLELKGFKTYAYNPNLGSSFWIDSNSLERLSVRFAWNLITFWQSALFFCRNLGQYLTLGLTLLEVPPLLYGFNFFKPNSELS